MKKKFHVEFNPDFFNDLVLSVEWYNEHSTKLGDRFYKKVKKQTAKLSTSAFYYAVKYCDIRCMPIENFPYLVHYRVNEETNTIKVEAMFHTSRNPNTWNKI